MKNTPVIAGAANASGLRIALVVSAYHAAITGALRDGAIAALGEAGADTAASVTVIDAPGAFEIPFTARCAAASGRFDAVVCLGCIVRGKTPHFDVLASAVAHAVATASQVTNVPITFGVLTTNTMAEAEVRSRGDGNKGREAALAAVQLANVQRQLLW